MATATRTRRSTNSLDHLVSVLEKQRAVEAEARKNIEAISIEISNKLRNIIPNLENPANQNVLSAINNGKVSTEFNSRMTLKQKEDAILHYARHISNSFTNREVSQLLGISTLKIGVGISSLINKGILKKNGSTYGARYTLK